ncbi:putative transposase/invertase (TIGR01784 family) [Arcticibacter tournemirensis]|uniref:Rpn family recombination-promoting nuclease/putative transposase n=1 Tax=Arcticibacter tournemirensis TaxID=699437 RepID=A0A5M9GWS5_9SPHI|nr:Rpn family recombination-promoting nuclease/putative transposase [Arcticibacter tournemirensis]KAA8478231.1 Rpn family recombination-promoting nuclease/putative transposase [Arcticibacter tournemirensis]TQM50742.1 putative transposase/invertase (TIGR01784 family) [Arcticibacter tournemirensis]
MNHSDQPITTKFIDPLTDYGFRFYFASEPRKEILIEFLNDLFDGERYIEDLEYTPTEHDGDVPADKRVMFDLNCRGRNNEHFIIEMQRVRQEFFRDRALYYTSRLIHRLLSKGGESNQYELPAVYLIGVLEFRMDDNEKEQYFYDIALADKITGKQFYNKLGFKFLELSNFVKEEHQLESYRDKWMYLLKHMHKMDRLPTFLDKRVFQKIFSIAEVSKLTTEERMAYEASLKAKWDSQNAFAYVEKRVREEEQAKMLEERRNIARAMKADGLSVAQISKFTGLSPEEIQGL